MASEFKLSPGLVIQLREYKATKEDRIALKAYRAQLKAEQEYYRKHARFVLIDPSRKIVKDGVVKAVGYYHGSKGGEPQFGGRRGAKPVNYHGAAIIRCRLKKLGIIVDAEDV